MSEVLPEGGYTVSWKKVLDTVTGDVTAKAVYAKIEKMPQTGENGNLLLWIVTAVVSGGLCGILVLEKRKENEG